MNTDRKQKLVDLTAPRLADALLELATHSEVAVDLIERLIATPTESIQRFRKKLTSLKRSRRFIGRRESFSFAQKLEVLLEDLKAGVTEPLDGIELVAAFYQADHGALGNCDDSDGCVGDVFRYTAKDLLVAFASRCTDKEKIAAILLKLNRKNDHGVRDASMENIGSFLPEPVIRKMITKVQKRADGESDKYQKRHHLMLIETMARQIKDPQLFEQTRIASLGDLSISTAAFIDIGRVYLESGDVETAYSWLKKIPENENFLSSERDELIQEIYTRQGNNKKLTALLYRQFRTSHSIATLENLLAVIGSDKRDETISKEVELILASPVFRQSDVEFLIAVGKTDAAESLVLERAEQLNGDYYQSLPRLAKTMESEHRYLAASLIYRSLLISILDRASTKAYPYGVRYLKKLDELASLITQWLKFDTHEIFKDQIYLAHGRKHSFWSKYEQKKSN